MATQGEVRLRGLPLSPGVALGRACFYRSPAHPTRTAGTAHTAIAEKARLQGALEALTGRLNSLARDAEARIDAETAAIFGVHRMILDDAELRHLLFRGIEQEGLSAEAAVSRELQRYQGKLRALDSEYMQERAADIAELQQALLERLRCHKPYLQCAQASGCQVGECRLHNNHILVVLELTPGLTLEVDHQTLGFVVEKGGPTSHAAILAKALGLPAVSGIERLEGTIPLSAEILVDGDSGLVILNPSADTLGHYRKARRVGRISQPVTGPVPDVTVLANIDLSTDVTKAVAAQAEGVGLYRTEIEALVKGRLLTEAEQEERFRDVLTAMGDKPVYVRLLDLGADKSGEWLELPAEANPALGMRGARLLLFRPELLREQARALTRAARFRRVHVVYPMVATLGQFHQLRALFDAAADDLPPGLLSHGVMFEVPSACVQAGELLAAADFGCIGSNDLIQYLFAADRGNENIDYNELLGEPALWKLLDDVRRAAMEARTPLSLCGDLAGDARITAKIIAAGFQVISVAPGAISQVRQAAQGGRSAYANRSQPRSS